jgi:hypothetical protein
LRGGIVTDTGADVLGAKSHRVDPDRGARISLAAGALLAVAAIALYVSGTSRAVGVCVAPVAVLLLFGGLYTFRARRWPPRAVVFGFAVLLVLLAAYGLWVLVRAQTTPITLVVN